MYAIRSYYVTTRFPAPPPWLRLMLIGTLWFSLAQVAIKILAKELPVSYNFV